MGSVAIITHSTKGTKTTSAKMKVAIIFTILCLSTSALADIDLDAVFSNLQPPYQCSQCTDALEELKVQVCGEIDLGLDFFNFELFCNAALEIMGPPVAKAFCTPFGVCKDSNGKFMDGKPVTTCKACPDKARIAFKRFCNLIPNIVLFNPQQSCHFIVDRFTVGDLQGACTAAGFC